MQNVAIESRSEYNSPWSMPMRVNDATTRTTCGLLIGIVICFVAACGLVSSPEDEPELADPGFVFPLHHEDPAWSPGGLIAFRDHGIVCVSPGGGALLSDSLSGIWLVDPMAEARSHFLHQGYTPAWSPNGTQLAFEAGSQIHVIGLDSSGYRQLTNTGRNFFPAWSPDGERIAFTSARDANFEVYVMNPDGTEVENLTRGPAADKRPAWGR